MCWLGVTPREFMQITPIEFHHAMVKKREFIQNENEFNLSRTKIIAETIRMETLFLVNVQLPRNKKIRKAQRLFLFDWERPDPTKVKRQTREEMKAVMKAIARGNKKR